MALFEKNKPGQLKPYVVRTENVAKEIAIASKKYGINAQLIDFNILDVQTLTRKRTEVKKQDASDVAWEEVLNDFEENPYNPLVDKMALIDPLLEIKQVYEVEIKPLKVRDEMKDFDLTIGANKQLTKVFATIKKGAHIEYFQSIEQELVEYINKRKLRANIMINVWEGTLGDVVKKLVAKIRVAESLTFEKSIVLPVGECYDMDPTVNDQLILHYENKIKNRDEYDRIDYAKRGFIKKVAKGEVIIEYVKPQDGTAGRTCRGNFVPASIATIKHEPKFDITPKIVVKEGEKSVMYYANEGGYVVLEKGIYDIRDHLDIDEISFKKTGSIDAGTNTDVSIHVKQKDVFRDAIGTGMEVDVTELKVEGSVADHAKVNADTLLVEGQTHQTSIIHANEAKIHVHKGELYATSAHITRIESGKVEADYVFIGQAIGGEIRAKEVVIDVVGSHAQIFATNKIEIKSMKGEENSFIIDPYALPKYAQALKKAQIALEESEKKIESMEKELEQQRRAVDENRIAFNEIKTRVAAYKKSGVNLPSSFTQTINEFQGAQKRVRELTHEIKVKRMRHEELLEERNKYQVDMLKSKVINRTGWRGHNSVRFRLISPEIELEYNPKNKSQEQVFMLEKLAGLEDEYQIVIKNLKKAKRS
jgi:hypothetical protein